MKINKIYIISFFCFGLFYTSHAQQDPHYTQYMYNQNVINPAYAGSKETLSISLLARSQWLGFAGTPKTYTLSIHAPLGLKTGGGISVIHDEIGPVKEDNIFADFSYSIPLKNTNKLAFGLKTGATILNIKSIEGIDADMVLNEPIQKTFLNFGAGIFYYTNKFYAGFSIPNFLNSRHLETKTGIGSTASEKKHYFFTSGYVLEVSETVKLKSSTMLKATSGAPLSVDFSLNTLINNRFELGINYRFDDSFSAMFGIQINNDLQLGYAYDYTTSNLGKFNDGSHEIMLIYDYKIIKGRIKSPRYF